MSSPRRLGNVAAGGPIQSQYVPGGSTPTCELSDQEWVQERYINFRGHVRALVVQEPKLEEWATWLDKLPLAVFLAGCDHEVRAVRAATTDEQRFAEADLVLSRWALEYDFDLRKITSVDNIRLQRYVLLFSAC